MVLSLLISFGTVFGAGEGIRASQTKSRREEHRSRKNNLVVHCPKSSEFSPVLEGRRIVLSGDKLYVDTGTMHDVPFGHPFAGYYLAYPDTKYSGLVSTITDEAPIMNWIYVHRDTYEVKFGNRQFAEGNLTGPYDCTRQDRRLTLGGWEGFVVVREESGFWALYFDLENDRLRSRGVSTETAVIEVELIRREIRTQKPPPPPEPEKKEEKQTEGKGETPEEAQSYAAKMNGVKNGQQVGSDTETSPVID
ncbi:hypothetical protein QBC46DRAFT_287269 [Diplogelasinospora grovesii]|uniref:Uncharacterized protein n=1 Tax=Diplogelasinospora grovesii TaxID=303347 RepID=A0AAN6S576_9PEZI|nr:hypothetical protein QBC46DRAFT_287269 [Diplogelasinospora grovesii]